MKDSRGISLGHKDIVARRTEGGWRISRVALVGYADATKSQPLAMCIDFEAHGTGNSWQPITEPSTVQRVASGSELVESSEALYKRLPELSKVLDDFELHQLHDRFKLA